MGEPLHIDQCHGQTGRATPYARTWYWSSRLRFVFITSPRLGIFSRKAFPYFQLIEEIAGKNDGTRILIGFNTFHASD